MKISIRILVLSVWLLAATGAAMADEGMWLLNQLPAESLQKAGLQVPVGDIYRPDGVGLAQAVCQVGGGTGEFVSPEGLILTNHHVAYGAIQFNSDARNNYLANGFLASSLQEELRAPNYLVYVLQGIKDVTSEFRAVLRDDMTPRERHDAIEKKTKELIKAGETASPGVDCRLVTMFDGLSYYLYSYLKLRDIRLVYAPPQSIGNYGGEVDNWMWPRHTGDFSILRAYTGPDGQPADYSSSNVPYKPKAFLTIAKGGVADGAYVMVIGYPGRTMRYKTADDVEFALKTSYPYRVKYFQSMIRLLEDAGKADPELAVRLASKIRRYANTMKNNQGMIEGLAKNGLYERKCRQEAEIDAWLKAHPDEAARFGHVREELQRVLQEQQKWFQHDMLLGYVGMASDTLGWANTVYRWSLEKEKPDMERESAYMDRNIPQMKSRLKFAQRNYHAPTDEKVLALYLLELDRLPEGTRVAALDKALDKYAPRSHAEAVPLLAHDLVAGTRLGDAEARMRMFDMKKDELLALHDPCIDFMAALSDEIDAMHDRDKAESGALNRLDPLWIQLLARFTGRPLSPDANGNIRLTYGTVRGYMPRDAVYYEPFTTLAGVLEKNSGEEPFNCPEKLFQLYQAKDFDGYEAANLKDVPVDFLADTDITGGNSGSPVLNSRGELVGIAFDGNYESMTSDWQFDPPLTRTLAVDGRYVLFILDKFSHAERILKELSIR
jgi:hypothetical protein